jgi:nucleoid-associated protein YgaU
MSDTDFPNFETAVETEAPKRKRKPGRPKGSSGRAKVAPKPRGRPSMAAIRAATKQSAAPAAPVVPEETVAVIRAFRALPASQQNLARLLISFL